MGRPDARLSSICLLLTDSGSILFRCCIRSIIQVTALPYDTDKADKVFFHQNSRDLGWGSSLASKLSTVEESRPEPGSLRCTKSLMHISAITTFLKPDRRCRRKNSWKRHARRTRGPVPSKQGGRWGPTLKVACTHTLWLLLNHARICTHMNMHTWIHHTQREGDKEATGSQLKFKFPGIPSNKEGNIWYQYWDFYLISGSNINLSKIIKCFLGPLGTVTSSAESLSSSPWGWQTFPQELSESHYVANYIYDLSTSSHYYYYSTKETLILCS